MLIKMIGLGKMGKNLALNMLDNQIDVLGYDINETSRTLANKEGIKTVSNLSELIDINNQNIIWTMLPAGKITQDTLKSLAKLCHRNDIVIDGGNSDYRDSINIAQIMAKKEIHFFDIGTSGGIYGARHGASFMCGGNPKIFNEYLRESLEKISLENGCLYTGEVGSGHYLKIVHNAMLYGYMQTLGEGFELLEKSQFNYNLENVALSLSKSSVIRGWLLELVANAIKKDPHLENILGVISASKTTNWTIESALNLGVPIPVISLSLIMRLKSSQQDSFSSKLIAALRDEVGGHKAISK